MHVMIYLYSVFFLQECGESSFRPLCSRWPCKRLMGEYGIKSIREMEHAHLAIRSVFSFKTVKLFRWY